jgi:flavin-dependent dehydrogenase
MKRCDVVIVGGRCAGSALAIELARGGLDVLIVDRDELPGDTLSTNGLWPNGVARLDSLGVLDLLQSRHRLHSGELRWRAFEHEFIGSFTPVDGHAAGIAPRRMVIDKALLDTAVAAGAHVRLGVPVVGLIGSGTESDPVRGVVLKGGESIEARWVIGADGRSSMVARSLGIPKTDQRRAEMALMYAYWRGLPDTQYMHFHAEEHGVLTWGHCEDDIQMVVLNGKPDITSGGPAARERAYAAGIRQFPETMKPEWLDSAERVSDLWVAPETMLRGHFRTPVGPGWALVGDSGHFKHPSTGQGIGDALEQAHYVAEGLLGADPELAGFAQWRDRRAQAQYAWSFDFGRLPRRESAAPLFAGIASEADAAQDFRDTFTRRADPRTDLLTAERRARWFGGKPRAFAQAGVGADVHGLS